MTTTGNLRNSADGAGSEQKRPTTHRTPEEILSHPRFATARTACIEGILGLYENNPFMSRLLIEVVRSLVFFTTLVIDADHDVTDRATWPTIGLLKQTLEPYGLSTARRVDALVAQFADAGYLRLSTPATDRRVRLLTPTEKMIAHDLDWLVVHYRPLRVLFPEAGYDPPMRRDPTFQKALRKICRQFQAYAAELMAANHAVMFFMQRDAGTMILLKMISLANEEGVARVSFTDLADRFGISRTHVRKTIQEAEKRSLLRCSETAIALAPSLVAAYDRFVADTMSGHDLMFQMATSQG